MNFVLLLLSIYSEVLKLVNYRFKNTLFIIVIFLSSCVGTQYLEENQNLLYKQKIKGNENISSDKLDDLYVQETNRKLLLLPISPYVAFYEIGKENYNQERTQVALDSLKAEYDRKIAIAKENDNARKANKYQRKFNRKADKLTKKIQEGNLLMRWGEPLAVYDSSAIENTKNQIQLYYESKGYFDADVTVETKLAGLTKKRVIVNYIVEEGHPHIIDTVFFNTGKDTTILNLVEEKRNEILLKERTNYDQAQLSSERERIEILLKNSGYYAFNRQFIEFNVYQSADTNLLSVEILINRPSKDPFHKRYTIDEVNFTTDVNSQVGGRSRQLERYNSVNYYYYQSAYNKKILDQRVFLRPGEYYSLEETFTTQRQLANLDMFRFVNIKYDTAGGEFIANIFTSPLDKYQISNEVGVNVNVTFGLPGPFYNVSLKNRNPFGGIEILELSGRVGFDAVANLSDQTQVTTATEARVNLGLTFPHFLLPFGNQLKSHFGVLNPKTKTGLGYNYTERPEYVRSNFNASYGYSWQNRKQWIYDFTFTDVNLIESKLDSVFEKSLEGQLRFGNQLRRSFQPSFVSSSYINITKNFNNYGTDLQKASFVKFFAEAGGNLLNFDFVAPNVEDSALAYFQFVKAAFDFRHYLPFGRESTLAFRVNVGAAKPYGSLSEGILPYEKYFFAGGSNSIRAWAPRRLGPGSYVAIDSASGNFDYSFEQPGEIIFEASLEARRNIIGVLDGALFIDAGNVWNFSSADKPGSEFKANRFYKQIAIGTGFGLRIDFSFLILRFDIGYKVYDPAREPGSRWTVDEWNLGNRRNYGPALNIGIGYPF
ncbi:BamA/TamA family outer membrane protein [Marivirga sp. S37H4]|uniref:BamA/TamA family outer membrane protein n=1 Tax=Marivirga aurantiaca TaxID=2802615 RepID=A0A935CB33_9BACT|nr:BamA/TamA family outer membrane protein [Marivirga aurantiaca]MBK6266935.1 BamA/TamA family outer membrane protein [Marivirga aurantiaca]